MVPRLFIVAIMFFSGGLYLASVSKSEIIPLRRSFSDLPAHIGDWEAGGSAELDEKTLKVLGVNDYVNRMYYGSSGEAVALYIGFYSSQRQGDTIHSPLNCLPGSGWNPIKKAVLTLPVRSSPNNGSNAPCLTLPITINRIVIQKSLEKQMVLYWYQSHGRVISSDYWGKIHMVIDAIKLNRTDAALVRLISPIQGDQQTAETDAERHTVRFVKDLFPLLSQYLPD
jgi:EpsI family protein